MARLQLDQINLVVPDVVGAADFLRAIGVEVPELDADWAEWAPHHIGLPVAAEGFAADVDSPAFAALWGGLPADFAGVVVNLRVEDRPSVDDRFARALELGAEGLHDPYDAFWGARYAVVRAPGPLAVGIMSPVDGAHRTPGPDVADLT